MRIRGFAYPGSVAAARWRTLLRRGLPLALLLALLNAPAPLFAQQANLQVPKFGLQKPPEDEPVDVLAETIIYDQEKDIATALGDVRIIWGPYLLVARKVVYHRKTDRFQAEGEVYLREPEGNVLMADIVNIDKKFRDGFARHLRLLMTNGATLKARYAVRREGNITTYTDVAYTACYSCRLQSGTPLWEITSEKAVHDENKGRIYHQNMKLKVAGVPVFWLPWLSHPDPKHPRSTGFLIPKVTYSEERGVSVTTPYFINLAPNYDLTLLPQFSYHQGVLARARWRHNVGPGTYEVDAGGIYQLKPNLMPANEQNRLRWFAKAKGEFAINRIWRWGFEGMLQSDRGMMRRYQVDSRDVAHSRLWLSGLSGRNYFLAEAGRYRGLNSGDDHELDPYTLPWVQHEYTFQPPVLGGTLSWNSSAYSIWRGHEGRPIDAAPLARRNSRLDTALRWEREWITPSGVVLSPFAEMHAQLREVRKLPDIYAPGSVIGGKTSARVFPQVGLRASWPLMAGYDLGYQVLQPVAEIIAAPSEKGRRWAGNEDSVAPRFDVSSLFLGSRFPGTDRLEGGVRANVGLLWNVYSNTGGAMRITLGQSYHMVGRNSFADSSIGLSASRSDFVAGVMFEPDEYIRLSWHGRFASKNLKALDQVAEVTLNFDRLQLSATYARLVANPEYGHTVTDGQFSGNATLYLTENWYVFGGINYNADNDDYWHAKRYIGLGVKCDCLNARITYSEKVSSGFDIAFGRSISLDIELKTLGTYGFNPGVQ